MARDDERPDEAQDDALAPDARPEPAEDDAATEGDAASDDESADDEPVDDEAADDESADDAAASKGDATSDDDAPPEAAAAEDEAASDTPASADVPEGPPRAQRYWMTLAVLVVLLAFDLGTKQWAWDNLRDGPSRTIIEGWVYFQFDFNTGSAFSFLHDVSWGRIFFIAITVLALIYMGYLAKTLPTRFASAFVAIGMVASGALGNLHDRFFRVYLDRHGVVDFIRVFYWKEHPWPTFNIADVALVAGVVLLLAFLLRHGDVLDAQARERAEAKGRGKPDTEASAARTAGTPGGQA